MDHVLLPYLQATEEPEREQRLEEMLLFRAAPEIRFTLCQRLGFHVSCTHADQLANGGLSNQGLTKLLSTW